ncbi:TPA: DUF551 domain-containing protein, partial [Klebsiella variicola]
NQLNRERLEKIKSWRETYGAGSNVMLPAEEAEELARIALAAMESEPVAWTWHYREQWHVTNDKCRAEFVAKDGDVAVLPLYRHAQPAPVVPENCVTAEHRRVIEMLLNVCGAAFELTDDSCQQDVDGEDCHVVPDDAFQKLSDALDEIENTLPTEDIDRPDVFLAWSAMPRAALKSLLQAQPVPVVVAEAQSRAAMLKAQPQNAPQNIPEIIPGWIPVSERLPEAGGDMIVFTDGIVMSGVSYAKKKGFYIQALEYDDDEPVDSVTHWMPLPAAPQEANRE